MTSNTRIHDILFQPSGRRVRVDRDCNLLIAAQRGGVDLIAVCNGIGICGACKIIIVDGPVSSLSRAENNLLRQTELDKGYRLACCTKPRGDVTIEVPKSSLPFGQRLQIDGEETVLELAPVVFPEDVKLEVPGLTDLRSDLTRVNQFLLSEGKDKVFGNLRVIGDLSISCRKYDWETRLVLRKNRAGTELVASLPPKTPLIGLAADLGSTKLAFYLINIHDGSTIASMGVMNPQINFGEDIVSRIAYANEEEENRRQLQKRLVETINESITELCAIGDVEKSQIVDIVFVGNTAIHHFITGLPVRQLGETPYIPAFSDPIDFKAHEIGIEIAPGAQVHMPPIIAGYVGADHTAALLSKKITGNQNNHILVDIGTNTEISLIINKMTYTCSTASGPAFEGAHIRDGMRAAPGAIEKVHIIDHQPILTTIDNQAPIGICGTGILSAIAELIRTKMINKMGQFSSENPRVVKRDGRSAYLLASGEETGHGSEILITRTDINEIQLAKGAIRTGIEILLKTASIHAEDVNDWFIAGAFGTFLDISSAMYIGMFPTLPIDRFHQIGNAAGMGAKYLLISRNQREIAQNITKDIEYIELTVYPDFKNIFLESLYF